MAGTPTLADFGHSTMVQNGRGAVGGRSCMIVLAEYEDFPPFSDTHPANYYQDLGFGTPTLPFNTNGNPASLREYFRENSHGRFWFDSAGVVGPIALGKYDPDTGGKPEARTATILDRVADQIFAGLDINNDDKISADELCVVIFENLPGLQPANRDNNPVTVKLPNPSGGGLKDKTVAVHIAGAGPVTPFYQIAHELSHSLGTHDLYGTGNYLLTLMGAYSFDSNDQATVHLDAWHKLQLGWIEPRRFDIAVSGSELVHPGSDGAVLLWSAGKLATDYFLVERRGPNLLGRIYDANVADDGLLIWHISNVVAHLGAPSLVSGGSDVWKAGQQTPLLRWSDGTSTGKSIRIATAANGALRMDWIPWGVELTLSEPKVVDVGGTVTRTKRDICGNVLQFGTWLTRTTIKYTVSEIAGFTNPTTNWTLAGESLAPGGTSIAIEQGGSTYAVDYQISPDGRLLTLTSAPDSTPHLTVGFHASDAAGHFANVEYLFSVDEGSYSGMRWESIGAAGHCIAKTNPITVNVDGFTMPWEEEAKIDARPIPLEWPEWQVEEWGQNALKLLHDDQTIDAASREVIRHYIDLQMNTPRFRVAARDLVLQRRTG